MCPIYSSSLTRRTTSSSARSRRTTNRTTTSSRTLLTSWTKVIKSGSRTRSLPSPSSSCPANTRAPATAAPAKDKEERTPSSGDWMTPSSSAPAPPKATTNCSLPNEVPYRRLPRTARSNWQSEGSSSWRKSMNCGFKCKKRGRRPWRRTRRNRTRTPKRANRYTRGKRLRA